MLCFLLPHNNLKLRKSSVGNLKSQFPNQKQIQVVCNSFIGMWDSYRQKPSETVIHDHVEQLWGSKTLNSCLENMMKFTTVIFEKNI